MSIINMEARRKPALFWTQYERFMLEKAGEVMSARVGGGYECVYYETDQGEPVCSFVVGPHSDATYTISKSAVREYVVLRWDGRIAARGDSVADVLAMILSAKAEDFTMAWINDQFSKNVDLKVPKGA